MNKIGNTIAYALMILLAGIVVFMFSALTIFTAYLLWFYIF